MLKRDNKALIPSNKELKWFKFDFHTGTRFETNKNREESSCFFFCIGLSS
ncbi:hypothetical protein Peur_010714 [Populus x canadensis]